MNDVKPGIYQHWKGDIYRVLFTAHNSNNKDGPYNPDDPVVIYQSLTGYRSGQINARRLSEFTEIMVSGDNTKARFELIAVVAFSLGV